MMEQDKGVRAGSRASHHAPAGHGHSASIPDAGHNQPDWFALAKALAVAVMFQRGTRGVHTVGRNGKVTHGSVSLLGDYAVDDMAKAFCDAAGIAFASIEPPSEHEAMFILMAGMSWQDWLEKPRQIRMEALGTGHPTKVDLTRLAQAMSAREGQDRNGLGGDSPASAVGPADAPNPHRNTQGAK